MAFPMKNLVNLESVIRGKDLRSGQTLLNILHWRPEKPATAYDAAVGTVTSTGILSAIYNAWLTVIIQTSIHYELIDITVREVVGTQTVGGARRLLYRGLDIKTSDPGADRGQQAGETLPPNMSASIRKVTNKSGRFYRGSMRFGLIPEAKQSNGALTSAYKVALQSAVDTLLPGQDTGSGDPDEMIHLLVLSKTVAFDGSVGLWTIGQAELCVANVAAVPVNPNVGSQQSRKARQSDLIDQTA